MRKKGLFAQLNKSRPGGYEGRKDKKMWYAVAEYADGTRIEKYFPYHENGNYSAECERQYDIECWLLSQHEDCTFYSVVYVEED